MAKHIITCAVTGGGPIGRHPAVPTTPKEIAEAAIGAAKAGAAVAHIHVREPKTGQGSMELAYYREVVERIRDSKVDLLINLTTGPGAFFVPSQEDPGKPGPGTNMRSPEERTRHVTALKPDICSLDLCTMWSRTRAFMNVPEILIEMARLIRAAGVLPELECFDSGDIALAKDLIADGAIEAPALFQLCLGIPYGAAATPKSMIHMSEQLPPGSRWASFGISRQQFPMVAQAVLLGGHVRVGLEDNHYLDRGVFADNAGLVERGVAIIRALGGEPATPAEAREILGLAAVRARAAA
ncbi:MAG TPA: 3-keto-5-aminohexanoate cleavage protein [Stellaceae bacterium]|nr:3-keto-5-aminohexanoate cleavage protein [Stellaceae bacterium]